MKAKIRTFLEMDSLLPVPVPGETTETYTYKLASHWEVQLNHVIVLYTNPLQPKYINLVGLVKSLLDPEKSIVAVCNYLNKKTDKKWDTVVLQILIYHRAKELGIENMNKIGDSSGAATVMRELLDRINEFCKKRGISLYTLASMQNAYSAYTIETRESLVAVRNKLTFLDQTQSLYESALNSGVLRVSELETFSENLQLIILGDLNREDTLTVFDNALVSQTIQHVACVYNGRTYQKVYKPGPFDPPVKRAAIISELGVMQRGIVVFTVSLSQVYTVRYTIESSVMETTIRIADKPALVAAIKAGFPMLSFEVRVRELESRLSLYPAPERIFSIPYHLLLHRIVVQPHLFQFYLNEAASAAPEKTTFTFQYKPFWVSSVIHREDSSFILSTPRMANGTNYISISLTSASESILARTLASLLPALCLHYIEDIVGVSAFAHLYNIPGLIPRTKNPTSQLKKELGRKYPEVFTKAYLDETPAKNLVRVTTDPEEAERWRREVIIYDQSSYNREVLPFPEEVPGDTEDGEEPEVLFWFTSSSAEAPRVGYRRSEWDDSPKYPSIPFSSRKGVVQKLKGRSGGGVVSLAALDEGLDAEAPDVISHILGFQARRRGVAFGPNSVLRALVDTTYEASNTRLPEDIEGVVMDARKLLYTRFEPELYKQQLYDLSTDEISRRLGQLDEYCDPLIYSAGIEELFNLDIYYIKAKIVHNVRTMTMELPRYYNFYCTRKERRKCIVVLINSGVRSDRLRWPHCELIVRSGGALPLHSVEVSARLAQIRERCHTFYTCVPGKILHGSYMSSAMDQVLSAATSVVSQYIDPNGKARAFTIRDKEDQLVTIFCSPCAPRSVPDSRDVHPAIDQEWLEEFCSNSVTGRSSIGVWSMHSATREILYVRTATTPSDNIPLTGEDPLTSWDRSNTSVRSALEISTKDRLALVLKELMIWLLDVSGIPAVEFIEYYVTYTDDPTDEDTYYDISEIGRRLPAVGSLDEAINYVSTAIPMMDGQFVLHNAKYYDSLTYVMSEHAYKSYDSTVPRFIEKYYQTISNFRADKNALIITGNIDPLTEGVDSSSKYQIADHISVVDKLPIFYIQDGTLWIVQGTHLKEMRCAYTICKHWRETQVNLGYNVEPAEVMDVDVLLYKLVAGRVVAEGILRSTGQSGDYFEVLQLELGDYAAMLRASS